MTTPKPPVRRKRKMKARTRAVLTAFIMGALVGMVLILAVQPTRVVYVREVPTQSTAVVTKAYTTSTPEDSGKWDCRKMGNHICGPGNPQRVKPGLYSAKNNGRLVITWYHLKAWGLI
jgi:hypothetical protein